jgi:hypothetical protein
MAPQALFKVQQTESRGEEAVKDATPAGCDVIRCELKQLRDDHDRWVEELRQVGIAVDRQVTHWHGFENSLAQLTNWLSEAEIRMKADIEARGFGPDKSLLEIYRVCS